jgi:hypothetical protein
MGPFQRSLEQFLNGAPAIAMFMQKTWSWPAAESIHFIGLSLLFGSIAVWDLRLLGVARNVPIAAFHRLVPFAVLGFLINMASGSMFLMTDADQYVYNPAFHLKLLFLALAGLNVLVFYLTMFRRVNAHGPGEAAPRAVKVSGAASLILWTGVIVCGRMLTFFRPVRCRPGQVVGFLADCIIRP